MEASEQAGNMVRHGNSRSTIDRIRDQGGGIVGRGAFTFSFRRFSLSLSAESFGSFRSRINLGF